MNRIIGLVTLLILVAVIWAVCAADSDAATPLKVARYGKVQGGAAAPDIVLLKCEDWRVSSRSSFYLVSETLDGEGGIRSVYRCIGP